MTNQRSKIMTAALTKCFLEYHYATSDAHALGEQVFSLAMSGHHAQRRLKDAAYRNACVKARMWYERALRFTERM